jgi:hypothetical protein
MTSFSNPQAMWDKRFSTPDYVFGEEPNAFLVSQAALIVMGQALAVFRLAHGTLRPGGRHLFSICCA